MKILIQGGRLIDPAARHRAAGATWSSRRGASSPIGDAPADFNAANDHRREGLVVAPGLVDLAARLREPGYEHKAMLESEMAAAVAGGVTSLVCPPDTDPVLDEPGLVEMLKFRAQQAESGARVSARRADARARRARCSPRWSS